MSPVSPSDSPRLARALLRLSVSDPKVREGLLGDLQEEYTRRDRRGELSNGSRWAWYFLAVTALAGRFLLASVRRAVGMGSRPPTGGHSKIPESMPDALLNDLRYAVRTLRKSPSFTATVVLSLALGIGATSTIFSALNPILLRPLPFPEPDRLVTISENSAESPDARRTPWLSTYLEWREENQAFEQIEWTIGQTFVFTYAGAAGAERNTVQWVSPGLFRMLGVAPILGRHFVAEDVSSGSLASPRSSGLPGVIISYGFWQRRFGGDPGIIGQTWSNQVVVGVMPLGFRIFPWNDAEFWQPLDHEYRDIRWMQPIGRLKPGATRDGAQAQLDAIARRLDQSGVSAESGWRVRVAPLHEHASARFADNLYLLMGAAVLLLLIACSNVASLLVGRATNRHREIATRAALGAGRLRLMRQFLTESVVLALFGGALGVLLAQVGTKLFVILNPTWYPPSQQIRVDGTVLGFTLGLSLLTAILFGMIPALRASNPDLARSLKQAGRGSPGGSRPLVQNLLVGAQIALTLVLLVGAGLMVNTFVRLGAVDRGFDPEHLLTADITLEGRQYAGGGEEGQPLRVYPEADIFFRQLLERLRAVPGVEDAEMVSQRGQGSFTLLSGLAPLPDAQPRAGYLQTTPGYFRVMRIPLLRGRSFTESDTESSSWVAIINEAFARQYFPDEDPVGSFLQATLGRPGQWEVSAAGIDQPREIVGIVRDTRQGNPRRAPLPTIHVPDTQHPTEYGHPRGLGISLNKRLVLKTNLDAASLAPDLRRVVAEMDPEVVVFDIQNMEARLDRTVTAERFWMRALGIFATLALVLAVVGIYGVVSYAVAQRTHEIGVRMALGAQRTDVLGMVIRQGMVMTAGGVIVGVLGAVAATRLLSSRLYGVEATDPATFATVSLVLVGIALLASYVPARRAARVDPLIALGSE